MFDIGMLELLIVGVVALIVVGPKDLPGMFRTLGRFTAKAKRMAREFQVSLEAAADESGVSDLKKDIEKATSMKDMGLDDPVKAANEYAKTAFNVDEAELSASTDSKATAALKKKAEAKKKAAAKTTAVKKPAPKKAAAKKHATKAPAAKKPSAKAADKKPAAKSDGAKKPTAKTAAKKPAATKTSAAKPTAKKPTAKKPAAKKPATAKAKT